MIEAWYNRSFHKSMILQTNEKSHWYLEWNNDYGCWTVSGVNLYWLVNNGWEKL